MPRYPFDANLDEILQDADGYVDAVFSCVGPEFLVMPKGAGFVEYPVCERGYESLERFSKVVSERNCFGGRASAASRLMMGNVMLCHIPRTA